VYGPATKGNNGALIITLTKLTSQPTVSAVHIQEAIKSGARKLQANLTVVDLDEANDSYKLMFWAISLD
jgi:hypothetical protein